MYWYEPIWSYQDGVNSVCFVAEFSLVLSKQYWRTRETDTRKALGTRCSAFGGLGCPVPSCAHDLDRSLGREKSNMADEPDVNSSRIVEGSLYSDLHGSVRYSLGQIGLQPLHHSAKKFVSSFLNNVVKKNYEEVEQKLQRKPVILEGFQTAQRSKKPKKKEMSAREKRIRGIYNISPKGQRYEMYVPLHKLWEGYMQSMLNLHPDSNLKAAYPKLLRADYHGCILNVSRSKCPSYVGTSGILLQETKNAFKIITKDNKLKMIPKANSVFTFELGGFEFTIHGNHFRYRSCERSARKFKRKPTTDL